MPQRASHATSFVQSGAAERTFCSRLLVISPTATRSTPMCRRSNLTHRPPDPELLACLSAAVRASTGKPFPHLRCVTRER
jgi:hypothetical protein